MNGQTTLSLEFHLETFQAALKSTKDVQAATAILEQVAKDGRMQVIMAEKLILNERKNGNGNANGTGKLSNGSDETQATQKQLAYLKRLGVECPDGLTKSKAGNLIDEALE